MREKPVDLDTSVETRSECSPTRVEIRCSADGVYQIWRHGKPFFVKGAGGFTRLDRLVACGGNSLRTWGSDQTMPLLPELRRHNLTFCAGLWMEPPRHGFDYGNAALRRAQRERILLEVEAIKREPGLLLWGLGNELDLETCDARVWAAVDEIACAIKDLDPLHPVITVISKPRSDTLAAVVELCPSIDAIGVNSYADMDKVAPSLDAFGWSGPYLVTEWGSDGSWEVPCAPWGAQLEPSSTQKADQMRQRYGMMMSDGRRLLGSYGFLWGHKQETTSTWFSLFDSDGAEYEGVQALAELWTGRSVAGEGSPRIARLLVAGRETFARTRAGACIPIEIGLARGEIDQLEVSIRMARESDDKQSGGDPERAAEVVDVALKHLERGRFEIVAPKEPGAYRVMVFLTNAAGQRASANVPVWVE